MLRSATPRDTKTASPLRTNISLPSHPNTHSIPTHIHTYTHIHAQIWSHLARRVLLPSHDFAAHLALADVVFRPWPAAALGRPPLWLPEPADARRTNIALFLDSIRVRVSVGCSGCVRVRAFVRPPVTGRRSCGWPGGVTTSCVTHALQDEPWWRDVTGGSSGSSSCRRTPEALVREWRLLQRASWEAPEAFWPAVLRHLRIRFHTPPSRQVCGACIALVGGRRCVAP